jgi:HK97 family phage major capsid protein
MSLEVIEQRLDAKLTEYQTFLDSKEPFNAERNATFQAEIKAIEAQRDAQRALDVTKAANEARKIEDAKVVDKSHRGAPAEVPAIVPATEFDAAKEVRAYDLFLRRGRKAVAENEELRSSARIYNDENRTYSPLDSTDLTLGQFLVPVTTGPEIEKKIKAVGQILTVLSYLNAGTGEPINWPTSDDTAEKGEFINENGAVSQSNPVFGNVAISAFQWSSKQVLVPLRLMQDSKFDVVAHLTECFGLRAGRGYSDRVINDGTDGLLNISGTGSLTAASATALNYYEALTLQGKIDLGYNQNGTYVMNFNTYLGFRALTSSTGVALWPESDYKNGVLHGKPFILCQDMPSFGTTGNKFLMFGDFSKVKFRIAGPMTVFRFNELFMNNLQQGFQSFQRIASKCIQPAAIAILKQA